MVTIQASHDTITSEELEDHAKFVRENYSADSFLMFYRLIRDETIPTHVDREWAKRVFDNEANDVKTMLMAARGLTKTTFGLMFAAYKLGHDPSGSVYLIFADDSYAKRASAALRRIIAGDKWRIIFPHVIPDGDRAWGAEAAWVKDTRHDYSVWEQMTPDAMNPSIRCVGYKSRIRGVHPSLLVWADDIHDEENAFSDRELERVKTFANSELAYVMQPHYPTELWTGTPFHEEDVYSDLIGFGYDHILTPAARNEDGNPAWPGFPTWPTGLPAARIEEAFVRDGGGPKFRREMLCDVTSMDTSQMPFSSFQQKDVESDWPVWGGVDFATVPEPGARMRHRSHAAIAWVTRTPRGQLVLIGGEVNQWTQGEVEDAMIRTVNRFKNFQFMAFDTGGKGEIFFETLMSRHPNMPAVPMPASTKAKDQRIFDELSPHLRTADLMVSNEESSEFLMAARNFCRRYPNVPHKAAKAWDVMDAFYMAFKAAQGEIGQKPKKPNGRNPFVLFGAKFDRR